MSFTAVAVGECMLELSRLPSGAWRMGQGGDTFNTAVYLSRLGLDTAYLTAVGRDPFSQEIRAKCIEEGFDPTLVLTDEERLPGLYAIQTDLTGERSFYYWRQQSAVRRLFENPEIDNALMRATSAKLLYLSGITLSLFDETGRQRLTDLARLIRANGGSVAFDPNYRPAGWPDAETARAAIDAIAPYVSIALPTFDDEALLFGDTDIKATFKRWRAHGTEDVVVKCGGAGCIVRVDGAFVEVPPDLRIDPVDTTGAGDSFNAGFLYRRMAGSDMIAAAAFANRLAGEVVCHPGAIIPQASWAAFRLRAHAGL
jgi:2-dehydro-3-deoxygluconokinase